MGVANDKREYSVGPLTKSCPAAGKLTPNCAIYRLQTRKISPDGVVVSSGFGAKTSYNQCRISFNGLWKMEDWEDETVAPVVVKALPTSKFWDDEDADEDGIKESWEDDDELILEPKSAAVPVAEKTTKKVAPKAKKEKNIEVEKEEVLDPLAEKLRQQRLVEEADFKSTTELFSKKGENKAVDLFIPKSESDFLEYAELISQKLRPYEKSFHYINLLKSVMRLSMTTLKGADAKEIASSVTAIANEKLKLEKEANAGKKKAGGKKKQLQVEHKPDEDLDSNTYDALDDYDFM